MAVAKQSVLAYVHKDATARLLAHVPSEPVASVAFVGWLASVIAGWQPIVDPDKRVSTLILLPPLLPQPAPRVCDCHFVDYLLGMDESSPPSAIGRRGRHGIRLAPLKMDAQPGLVCGKCGLPLGIEAIWTLFDLEKAVPEVARRARVSDHQARTAPRAAMLGLKLLGLSAPWHHHTQAVAAAGGFRVRPASTVMTNEAQLGALRTLIAERLAPMSVTGEYLLAQNYAATRMGPFDDVFDRLSHFSPPRDAPQQYLFTAGETMEPLTFTAMPGVCILFRHCRLTLRWPAADDSPGCVVLALPSGRDELDCMPYRVEEDAGADAMDLETPTTTRASASLVDARERADERWYFAFVPREGVGALLLEGATETRDVRVLARVPRAAWHYRSNTQWRVWDRPLDTVSRARALTGVCRLAHVDYDMGFFYGTGIADGLVDEHASLLDSGTFSFMPGQSRAEQCRLVEVARDEATGDRLLEARHASTCLPGVFFLAEEPKAPACPSGYIMFDKRTIVELAYDPHASAGKDDGIPPDWVVRDAALSSAQYAVIETAALRMANPMCKWAETLKRPTVAPRIVWRRATGRIEGAVTS